MSFSEDLLDWYDANHRVLPWRAAPGVPANPYYVWLSEIMLQQTTVATVKAYFVKFIEQWPTLNSLAQASIDDILHSWQGLGYYTRARNLYKCAQIIVEEHNGQFPPNLKELKKLPGIGDYTAAAILSIAFDEKATVIDGNVERVISRIYAIEEPLPASKKIVKSHADILTPEKRSGDYAQAMMDLGATICTPTTPKCLLCPVKVDCKALEGVDPQLYPKRLKKNKRPQKYGFVFRIKRQRDGALILRKRPFDGLLGGMIEVPSSQWLEEIRTIEQVIPESPIYTEFINTQKSIQHTFTHFSLELFIYEAIIKMDCELPEGCFWCLPENFSNHAIPTVMKKVLKVKD